MTKKKKGNNSKQGMLIYGMWLTEHQAKLMDEALKNNDWNSARVIFEMAFMDGQIHKK